MLLFGLQLHAQQKNDSKKTKKTLEYTINDKKVSATEFDKFQASLKEIEGTSFHAETPKGFMIRYNAKDKNGVKYQYREESDQSSSKISINKYVELK